MLRAATSYVDPDILCNHCFQESGGCRRWGKDPDRPHHTNRVSRCFHYLDVTPNLPSPDPVPNYVFNMYMSKPTRTTRTGPSQSQWNAKAVAKRRPSACGVVGVGGDERLGWLVMEPINWTIIWEHAFWWIYLLLWRVCLSFRGQSRSVMVLVMCVKYFGTFSSNITLYAHNARRVLIIRIASIPDIYCLAYRQRPLAQYISNLYVILHRPVIKKGYTLICFLLICTR